MTLEQFIKDKELPKGTYKDNFNKILPKLIKRYKYIDVIECWYDDEERPDYNTWIDVEGIGYGWLWCNYKTEGQMRKRVRKFARDIYHNEIVYIYNADNIKHIIFADSSKEVITMIRLSNDELDFI